MPLRASKMKGFIFGFHRLVWCPKWTPASNNSFTPILSTRFLWLGVSAWADHPPDHRIIFDVLVAAPAHANREHSMAVLPSSGPPTPGQPTEGLANIARSADV